MCSRCILFGDISFGCTSTDREQFTNQKALSLNMNNWTDKAFRAELLQIPCFEHSEVSDLMFSNSWKLL